MAEHAVCRTDQLRPGRGRPARAGDRELAVFAVAAGIRAIDRSCGHAGAPLDEGVLDVDTGCVACPWHGWTYDTATGDRIRFDGRAEWGHLRAYPVRVDGAGVVWVDVPEAGDGVGDATGGAAAAPAADGAAGEAARPLPGDPVGG